MKQENNSTETAKAPTKQERMLIFMQYWGHMVIVTHKDSPYEYCYGYLDNAGRNGHVGFCEPGQSVTKNIYVEQLSLWLKPLSKISEEDARKLLTIRHPEFSIKDVSINTKEVTIQFTVIDATGKPFGQYIDIAEPTWWNFWPQQIDVLREMGYAVPYKNWSVHELEKFGIFKLTER